MLRLLLCLIASVTGVATAADRLPALDVDVHETSVSGLSSGAFMAVQFHLAHSTIVRGAGIVAGGPWGCARGDWARALGECMKGSPDIGRLVQAAKSAAAAGDLDPVESLSRSRVWLFSGYNDGVVRQSVMNRLDEFYRTLAPDAPRFYRRDLPAGHAMVTTDAGTACNVTGGSFISDCDYDAAGNLLQFIHGRLDPPAATLSGSLRRFDQSEFASGSTRGSGLLDEGYVYVPKACGQGGRCRVHVALHGCEQSAEKIGDVFVRQAGYNRWADANRIVVLYPQTRSTWGLPWNPYGCWDWWGYTDSAYAGKRGAQVKAIRAMVDRLASGSRTGANSGPDAALPPAVIERRLDGRVIAPGSAVVVWRAPVGEGEMEIAATRADGSKVVVKAPLRDGAAVLGPLAPDTEHEITAMASGSSAVASLRVRTGSTPPACDPWFGTNVDHVSAGRAYVLWGRVYANGTHEDMGWWNVFTAHAMRRTEDGYALGPCS
ncbi:MAG: PHB depolymerase family esterase [Burkholderiales bacterium]